MSRLYARLQRDRLAAEQARAVRRALLEADPSECGPAPTAGGDEERLRGIPVVGRGVSGAIPGTRPG